MPESPSLLEAPSRVAFVGSRRFPDAGYFVDLEMARVPPGSTVVSGGARGVDSMAEQAAREFKLGVVSYRPEKSKTLAGRFVVRKFVNDEDAGLVEYNGYALSYDSFTEVAKKRNWMIVNDCDRLVALWDGMSGGTAHSIAAAARRRIPIIVHTPGDS